MIVAAWLNISWNTQLCELLGVDEEGLKKFDQLVIVMAKALQINIITLEIKEITMYSYYSTKLVYLQPTYPPQTKYDCSSDSPATMRVYCQGGHWGKQEKPYSFIFAFFQEKKPTLLIEWLTDVYLWSKLLFWLPTLFSLGKRQRRFQMGANFVCWGGKLTVKIKVLLVCW